MIKPQGVTPMNTDGLNASRKQKFLSVSSVFIRVLHETRGPVTQLSGNLL
jgi:hypothetical protein